MDEAKRGRVDAVAQAAAVGRTVGEDMAQVAVAVPRADLDALHAMRRVAQGLDVALLDRLGEARPPAARFVLVGRGEERLAGHDVDVDARLLVAEVLAGAGALGPALLRDPELLGR